MAPGSIGEELELEPGDVLLTIDGEEIEDIFDYDYMTDSESFVMTVQKKNGEEWELEIESGGEDLGLTFAQLKSSTGVMFFKFSINKIVKILS